MIPKYLNSKTCHSYHPQCFIIIFNLETYPAYYLRVKLKLTCMSCGAILIKFLGYIVSYSIKCKLAVKCQVVHHSEICLEIIKIILFNSKIK